MNVGFANLDGFASANFVVRNGENKLSRPVAGGVVKAGILKDVCKFIWFSWQHYSLVSIMARQTDHILT